MLTEKLCAIVSEYTGMTGCHLTRFKLLTVLLFRPRADPGGFLRGVNFISILTLHIRKDRPEQTV